LSNGFSIDDILAEVDKKRGGKDEKKNNPSITEILDVEVNAGKPREVSRPEPIKKPEPPVAPAPAPPAEKPAKREKPKKQDKTEDIVSFRKAKVLPKPIIDEPFPEPVPEPSLEIIPEPEPETEQFEFPILESTQALELPPTQANDPLEMLDGLNPYDILQPAPVPVSDEEIDAHFISMLSGDTKGIADGDLKELAGQTAHSDAATAEVVKTYMPKAASADPHHGSEDDTEIDITKASHLSEKAKRSNTALIDSLNKAIKDKRESDVNALRGTGEVEKDPFAEENRVTFGLNIDYKKQILTDTSLSLTEQQPQLIEHKIRDLAGKRKRKIRDFVLEDVEDDKTSEYYDESDYENAEDEVDYDTSAQTRKDLDETHKGLKIRFVILLILTGFAAFLAFMNDTGRNMAYNIFGVDVYFLDKRWDVTGYMYLNLMLGIFGVLTCRAVVTRGFTRLFSGKADCDSLCAVPAVVSVLSMVPMLSGTGFFQQGYTNIFVAAGLFGLLFNSIGKLMMMARAKRNFKFTSGDNPKYYADIIENEQFSRAFTKGVLYEIPVLCAVRKTEFLADFLKNTYCNDRADQLCRYLVPSAFAAACALGLGAWLLPYENSQLAGNAYWALTVTNAALCMLSPLSIMFLVNNPLLRVSKALMKEDAVVLGYSSAERFSKVNSVLVDASALFPAGSVDFRNLKRCQHPNSLDNFAIDDAIITAASLAIKSGSILTSMFYDMLAGKNELLYDIDNCIYEVNMGITGWMGNKRVMLGNRDQMKHHGIRVPDLKKEQKYSDKFGDVVYLAAKGETIAMFFLKIIPNPQIKESIQALQRQGISVIVRSRDSLITDKSLAEAFELAPEKLRVIPYDLHGVFDDCTRYASRGDGNVACSGRFSSFASALTAAKKVMHSIILSSSSLFAGLFLAVILCIIFALFGDTGMFSSTNVIMYNLFFFGAMLLMQGVKRY
jgi:Cu+-exporting ATPase